MILFLTFLLAFPNQNIASTNISIVQNENFIADVGGYENELECDITGYPTDIEGFIVKLQISCRATIGYPIVFSSHLGINDHGNLEIIPRNSFVYSLLLGQAFATYVLHGPTAVAWRANIERMRQPFSRRVFDTTLIRRVGYYSNGWLYYFHLNSINQDQLQRLVLFGPINFMPCPFGNVMREKCDDYNALTGRD